MISKVVAKKKNGSLIKGTTGNFLPSKNIFHVFSGIKATGDITEVNVDELKAVFFVKKLEGDRKAHDKPRVSSNLIHRNIGKNIRVVFHDDEIIEGFSHSLHLDRNGFFMVPSDLESNNERIFVVLSSIKRIIVNGTTIRFSVGLKTEKTCKTCGSTIESSWKFCPFDGTKLTS